MSLTHKCIARLAAAVAMITTGLAGTAIAQRDNMVTPDMMGQNRRNDPQRILPLLKHHTLQQLAVPLDVPAQFSLAVKLGDRTFVLELVQHSVRSADFQATVELGRNRSLPFDPGPDRTYRGEVAGVPGSQVTATLFPSGRLTASIDLGGEEWHIEELVVLGGRTHVVFRGEDIEPLPADSCGVHHQGPQQQPGSGFGPRFTGTFMARIAVESDYEFYDYWGGDWFTEISGIINDVSTAYDGETSICYTISMSSVWTANNDPYTNDDANDILNAFRERYNGQFSPFRPIHRTLAHLFSGKDFDGSTVGLAWVGTINTCGSNGFTDTSNAQGITENVDLRARRKLVCAHEIGHNWGCNHCDGDPSCGIMLSSIPTVFGPFDRTFGSTSATVIINARAAVAPCARECGFDSTNTVCSNYCTWANPFDAADLAPDNAVVRLFPYGQTNSTQAWGVTTTPLRFMRPMTLIAPAGPVRIGQ